MRGLSEGWSTWAGRAELGRDNAVWRVQAAWNNDDQESVIEWDDVGKSRSDKSWVELLK